MNDNANIYNIKSIPVDKEVLDRINAVPIYAPAPKSKDETYGVMLYYDYQGWAFMGDKYRTRKECEEYMRILIVEDKYTEYEYMVVRIENYYTDVVEYIGEELVNKLKERDI